MASVVHQPIDTDVSLNMPRKDFKDSVVLKLSITSIVLGCLSIACGVCVEVLALMYYCPNHVKVWTITTQSPYDSLPVTPSGFNLDSNWDDYGWERNQYSYNHHDDSGYYMRYYYCHRDLDASKAASGIWCGVFFLVSGIMGIFAARRKTTCMIVTLMAVSITSIAFAVVQCILCVMGAVHAGNLPSVGTVQFKIPIICINGVLGLFGLVEFILLVTAAVFSCKATCCETSPIYLTTNIYEPVVHSASQILNEPARQPFLPSQGQLFYAPPNLASTMTGSQPIILIPYNQNAFNQQIHNNAQIRVPLSQLSNMQCTDPSALVSQNKTPASEKNGM